MKKKLSAFLLCLLLFLTGCASRPARTEEASSRSSTDEFTQKYLLTAFYGTEAERNAFLQEKKKEDGQHSIFYDETSGCMTITASLTQAQYWVRQAENDIEQNALTIRKEDGYSLSINASDTQMTISISDQTNLNTLRKTADADLMAMEIHQVFNGISSWHIDVEIINQCTQETIRSFSLPDEPFVIDKSLKP